MKTRKYKIKSLIEKDNGRFLYWNNEIGWTWKKYSDTFTSREKETLTLPTWSKWEGVN